MGMAWGRWKRYEKIRGKLKRRFFWHFLLGEVGQMTFWQGWN